MPENEVDINLTRGEKLLEIIVGDNITDSIARMGIGLLLYGASIYAATEVNHANPELATNLMGASRIYLFTSLSQAVVAVARLVDPEEY